MIYADQNGDYDRLLDYTTAVTGVTFFAPSQDFLGQVEG
jgi:putative iron-dependent peroxidase